MSETAPAAESTSSAPASNVATEIDPNRVPDAAWLDGIEGELDDVELVLKCLARDSAKICETCTEATAAGTLVERPVLARCASSRSKG